MNEEQYTDVEQAVLDREFSQDSTYARMIEMTCRFYDEIIPMTRGGK